MPNAPVVLLQPLKSALIAGHDQHVQVLVRVQAPEADPARTKPRPPVHLALVIDRSGSMSGEPLHEARRCAGHIVDQLRPEDRAALVQFDSRVELLVAAQPVGDRRNLHLALNTIHAGGTTNLHGGWECGANALAEHVRQTGLSRVILLSDGNANSGLTVTGEIAAQCARLARMGVSTSTYGLGHSFNEELMVAMARSGQGNHYYGETAQDLFEPFAEEFDLIANLYVRRLRLSLTLPEGTQAVLLNDHAVEDQTGCRVIHLPDLAWGTEAWALLTLKVPAPSAAGGPVTLLQAEVTGTDLEGEPVVFPMTQLALPAVHAHTWEALPADERVQQRLNELQTAQFLDRARGAAQRGDWKGVEAMLEEARLRFADNPWVQQVLEHTVALARARNMDQFRKEAMYSSRRMHSRLSRDEEYLCMLDEDGSPAYLRRKMAQGKAQFRHGPGDPKDAKGPPPKV